MSTIRAFINLLFLGAWTVFMVSVAVMASVLRRDFGVFRRAQRFWARALLSFWGVELDVRGGENMNASASYVVMSNHLSYVDIVVLFLALPTIPGFLAKRELTRVPFLAAALRSGGHVVIDRQRRSSAHETISRAAEEVRGGKTVLVFPEGTRGDSDTVGSFKKGGFHLAKAASVPILPVGVQGTRAVFSRGSILIRPGRVRVRIGAPIDAETVDSYGPAELVQLTRARIMDLCEMPAREVVQDVPAQARAPGVAR